MVGICLSEDMAGGLHAETCAVAATSSWVQPSQLHGSDQHVPSLGQHRIVNVQESHDGHEATAVKLSEKVNVNKELCTEVVVLAKA